MYLFNLKSILWNFLKLCLIIIQLHHYIIIIRLREEKKKRKKKNSVPLPRYFFPIPSNECPVSMKFYGNVFTGGVATPCESTSFATLPRIAHVLFSNSAAIQSNLSRITVKLFPCVAPCREHMISTWRFDEIDQVIPRFIGERSAKIKMIMHDAHTIWLQISLHNIFILILYALLLCIPLFFFYFFILN